MRFDYSKWQGPRHGWEFVALCMLVCPTVTHAAPAKPLRVASLKVESHLNDATVAAKASDSALRRLMARSTLTGGSPPRRTVAGGYYEFKNPLESWVDGDASSIALTISIELEQCSYGRPVDTVDDIARFGTFGMSGVVFKSYDAVAGQVQWRATISWPGAKEPLVAVGRGICGGDIRKLSRSEALPIANHRALWDLTNQIAWQLGEAFDLGIRKKILSGMGEEKYWALVDGS